jgi:hypothetical protein
MDALSDVLRVVRLTGGVFLDAQFSAPWCVTAKVAPEDCRPFLETPQHVIAYHCVVSGSLILQTDTDAPIELRAGEIVLLPRNDSHRLGSTLEIPPVSADELVQPPRDGGLARIVHGGGGEIARIVCGFLGSDAPFNPLVATLPKVLKLDLRRSQSGTWIESSFQLAANEISAGRVGSVTLVSKLSELLFIEAVRQYVAELPVEKRGWLAGLRDPIVGRALGLLHSRHNEAWTAEDLAPHSRIVSLRSSASRRCSTSRYGACRSPQCDCGSAAERFHRLHSTWDTNRRLHSTGRSSASSECPPRRGGDRLAENSRVGGSILSALDVSLLVP